MDEIISRLAEIMAEKGVGVRRLSRITGITPATVRRMRRESPSGSIRTWMLVADALGASLDELVGDEWRTKD